MKPNALRHAINTVQNALDEEAISVIDAALILELLPHCTGTQPVQTALAEYVKTGLTEQYSRSADLAVLFLILAILHKYDNSMLAGNELALAVRRLVDAEDSVGGPYKVNGTLDIATNACVALCMKRMAVPLPNVDAFLQPLSSKPQTELRIFPDALLTYIYAQCNKLSSGLFEVSSQAVPLTVPLYIGQDSQAAACLAAVLDIYNEYSNCAPATIGAANSYAAHQAAIFTAAKALFSTSNAPLRRAASQVHRRIAKADDLFEISMLPAYFYASLRQPASTVCTETLLDLGTANVHTWTAYTVYDDFLDGAGQPAMMPVAHMAVREALRLYTSLMPTNRQLHEHIDSVYRTMDEANAWESAYGCCQIRPPYIIVGNHVEYGECNALADRSLAHTLGPMCVLALQGVSLQSEAARTIQQAFRQYLIARQLNDDAHDWAEDIQDGHVTYVVAATLRDMQLPPGRYVLERLLPAMQGCFWNKTSAAVSKKILRHIAAARAGFAKSKLFQEMHPLETLLYAIERSAKKAQHSQQQGQDFLQAFSQDY